MSYLGDFVPAWAVRLKFDTSANGAPVTLGGTPAVAVYKDDSDVERDETSGLTVDFDGITGLHHVSINLSADGTFYSAGSDFTVVLTSGTVDGLSQAGRILGSFSIEGRAVVEDANAIREVVNKLDDLIEDDGGGEWRYTNKALEEAADVVWATLTSTLTLAGSIGKLIVDKLGLITSGSVTVVATIDSDGDATVKAGDDYDAASGPALDFTYDGPIVLTGLTPTMKIYLEGGEVSFSGEVIGAGSPWTVRFEPTSAQTGALRAGRYRFDVEVTVGASKRTPFGGTLTVLRD